jgi:hypothetical protein
MTTPGYRALCAELLQPLAEYDSANPYHEHRALIARARAALAQPAPPTIKEQALGKVKALLNNPNRAFLADVYEALEIASRALEQAGEEVEHE